MENFADRLRRLREGRGLRQKDIAAEFFLKPSTYQRYENVGGHSEPPYDLLSKISRFFGVSVDYLVTGETPPALEGITEEEKDHLFIYRQLSTEKRAIVRELAVRYYRKQSE